MLHKLIHNSVVVISIILFLFSLNACRTTGGNIGIDWGKAPKHKSPPPSYDSHGKYKSKRNVPPAHAPAHGYRAKHRYRYYPDAYVYFDTAKAAYFYIDNANWRMSVSLPSSIRLGSAYVSLELDTDKPYVYHHEHRKKYPPGKMKKSKKKNR